MEKRIVLFLVLSFAVLVGHAALMRFLYGPPKPAVLEVGGQQHEPEPAGAAQANQPADAPVAGDDERPHDEAVEQAVAAADAGQAADEEPPADQAPPELAEVPAEQPAAAPAEHVFITLGSAAADGPYRMLVVLTNQGAAVDAIELNQPKFRDLDYRGGYLGYLRPTDDPQGRGTLIRVVGPGTPAARAGLEPGDVLSAIDDEPVPDPAALLAYLRQRRPGQQVTLSVLRQDQELSLSATLVRKPLNVIQPEAGAPPSLRVSLARLDDEQYETAPENDDELTEIPGAELHEVLWELVHHDEEQAVFRHVTRRGRIEVLKRYRLEASATEADEDGPHYHLDVSIELRNTDERPHRVAYALDGPNGLPTEGWWYASKISRNWGGVGLRDVAVGLFDGRYVEDQLFSCQKVAEGETFAPNPERTLAYIGVDAQYFSAILIPQKQDPTQHWFDDYRAVRVTPPPTPDKKRLTNTSVRLVSTAAELQPGEPGLVHEYRFFTGPKRPALLASYQLDDLVYYGWFGWVSRPMLSVLHFFHDFLTFGNYGLAIILLTVVVRSAMFPLSRKQALNAQKMQELQPELKRIAEKYKKDVEKRTRAQQELFKKHQYNPLGGCLLMFFQLPIFIGLYRSLMVDVELRQAPLISEAIRWCSNLAAPDMLLDWSGFMPGAVIGWLGPYLNVLPLVTVGLFLWQQKMFMPPATDEQTRMQQQVMKFMMLFMGLLFFKVASGLCLYFIASSVWGIAERKLLPRTTSPQSGTAGTATAAAKPVAATKANVGGNGAAKDRSASRRKSKGRR